MFIILVLIILVAAFNIVQHLNYAGHGKTRGHHVLKAMGARNASIYKIFMLEGMIIGVVGTKARDAQWLGCLPGTLQTIAG